MKILYSSASHMSFIRSDHSALSDQLHWSEVSFTNDAINTSQPVPFYSDFWTMYSAPKSNASCIPTTGNLTKSLKLE